MLRIFFEAEGFFDRLRPPGFCPGVCCMCGLFVLSLYYLPDFSGNPLRQGERVMQ